MTNKTQRYITYYNFSISTNNDTADNLFSINDIISAFLTGFTSGRCIKNYESDTLTVSIKDIRYDDLNNIFCLLICSTDLKATDPTFEDVTNSEMRTVRKKETEGSSISAHLAINTTPHIGNNDFLCVCEYAEGLSKSLISSFLDVLSRELCKEKEFYDALNNINVSVKPKLQINVIDDFIENDILKGGKIKKIIFETLTPKGDKFDEPEWVERIAHKVEINVSPNNNNILSNIKEYISNLCTKNKNFNSVKILYTTSSNKHRITKLQQQKDDAFSFSFGKVEDVNLSKPITDSALAKIDEDFYKILCKKIKE